MWAIHNTLKGWSLYDLSLREMQLLIFSLTANEKRLTYVCEGQQSKWAPLSDKNHSELFQVQTGAAEKYPELNLESLSHEDAEYFVVRAKKVIHPRLHKRYEMNIPCRIYSGDKEIQLETFDLSEGGFFFKDTLPDWVAGYFFVEVRSENTLFKLMCSLVEDQKERKRVQIVSEETDVHFLAFKNWLSQFESV